MSSPLPSNTSLPPWLRQDVAPDGDVLMEIEGWRRHFAAWLWEERVYFRDWERPRLIWATLETWDKSVSLSEFAHDALQMRKVGRYTELALGLSSQAVNPGSPAYSLLTMPLPFSLRVIVDEDNGGLVGHRDSQRWHRFEGRKPRGVNASKSRIPSIFSPLRNFKFLRHSVASVELELAREKLSELQWALWRQGATHPALRLVAIAIRLGLWGGLPLYGNKISDFWKSICQYWPSLPDEEWPPLLNIEGKFSLIPPHARYSLHEQDTSLVISVTAPRHQVTPSAHELLEAYAVLRDALSSVLPPGEVERVLAKAKLP